MKAMKKLASLLLALVMALALAVPAFAAGETYSIKITNAAENHVYEAYQIFSGDLSTNDKNEKVLSNIVWGSGVDQTKEVDGKTLMQAFDGKTAAEVAENIKTEEQAKEFAQKIAPYLVQANASTSSSQNSEGKYVISGLAAGYYLVKDKDNSLENKDDFYTAYIMRVVDNVEATPKGDKPTLDKEIKHNDGETWGDVGDNQIGDTVEFRTVSTVPDTSNYTSYTYIIHDTMSAGLTSKVEKTSDVTIKVNDENGDGATLDSRYYTVDVDAKNVNTFTVTINILEAVKDGVLKKDDKLYTYYSGVLNEKAEALNKNNTNEAYLEYSNNPNNSEDKATTPPSKVYDWTFQMEIKKVDENNNALTGAKFVLSKKGDLKVADMKCGEDGVPTVTTDLIGLVKDGDGVYRVAMTGESNAVYVIEAGDVTIKGLDDATDYYLYETKAPVGYNQLKAPVKFTITAAYNADGSQLAGSPTVSINDGAASTGLSANIENKAGSTLPSTGGIGTTIFYVVGSVLVIGAAVVLITRKRMGKSDK